MKKVLCLILAGLILAGCLAGCGKNSDPGASAATTAGNGTADTEPANKSDSVLPDKNWNERELKVFINQNDLVGNIIENDDTTDVVGYEVFRRNNSLEKKYNFYITCTEMTSALCPAKKAQEDAAKGISTYDLILDSVTDMKGALAQFVFADLADLDYIDWNAKGWLKQANDSLDIMGYRYICTGDANLYEKSGAILMYYNRAIMSSITSKDIRQLALDGDWTMEQMYELMKLGTSTDTATGKISVYGLAHPDNEAFYNYLATGFGMQIITRDSEGDLYFAFDDAGVVENTVKAIDEVLKFYCDEETTYNQRYKQTTPKAETIFLNSQSLFHPNQLSMIKRWKDGEIDYGFLPLPKADEETEKYGSAYYTSETEFFAIPYYAEDPNFSAFVLQAMMENSGELTHVYVEKQCKIRGSYDQVDYDLITLALDNFVYDLGSIYNWGAIETWIFIDRYDDNEALQSIPVAGVNNFVSNWDSKKELAHYELDEFLRHFQ